MVLGVPVFDLANCGPRHRFVIWTDAGPMVAHNCGFGLGGGEMRDGKKTGLWAYAESMGVHITKEEAARQVALFRSVYSEIPDFWKALEVAIEGVLTNRSRTVAVGRLDIGYLKPYLVIQLPSGRLMYYYQPRMADVEFQGRDGPYIRRKFTYMGKHQLTGKWCRIVSGGPKVCENVVQATARETFKIGALRAAEFGFDIVGLVHDEIISVVRKGDNRLTLDALKECMASPIPWANGLPLGADGYSALIYRK